MNETPSSPAAVPRPKPITWRECPCNTHPMDGCSLCAGATCPNCGALWHSNDGACAVCRLYPDGSWTVRDIADVVMPAVLPVLAVVWGWHVAHGVEAGLAVLAALAPGAFAMWWSRTGRAH